jgi:hypothetical protein
LKLLHEKVGKILEDMGISHYFLNRSPFAQEIKARIDNWDCNKLKFLLIKKNSYQNQETTHKNVRKSSTAVQQIGD